MIPWTEVMQVLLMLTSNYGCIVILQWNFSISDIFSVVVVQFDEWRRRFRTYVWVKGQHLNIYFYFWLLCH